MLLYALDERKARIESIEIGPNGAASARAGIEWVTRAARARARREGRLRAFFGLAVIVGYTRGGDISLIENFKN